MESKKAIDHYLATYCEFENRLPDLREQPFYQTRQQALQHFERLGFPSRKHEEWRFTDIAPLLKHAFALHEAPPLLNPEQIAPFEIMGMTDTILTLINGRFVPALSKLPIQQTHLTGRMPIRLDGQGLTIMPLDHALQDNAHGRLSQFAAFERDPFTALNTAFAWDGLIISIDANSVVSQPIHIIHLASNKGMSHPRLFIELGQNSRAAFIETYHALNAPAPETYFTNGVSEIILGEGAKLEHTTFQDESRAAFHVETRQVVLAKSSIYTSVNIDLGGALVRNNLQVKLDGELAETHLGGFYLGHDKQVIDNHTLIDHAQPRCESNQLYKGILQDKAHGIFNGKIVVQPQAQKTNAYQRNQCLLLSNEAIINAKPQLEIFADDVKCTHGATIGQLDEEALFYLRSRGIDLPTANKMLRHAFAGAVLKEISPESLHEWIENRVMERLMQCGS